MVSCLSYAKNILMIFTTLFIMSCSTDLQDYKETTPDFDLFGYFQGETEAWGMVKDYTDRQTRRFHVNIKGEVDGDTLILHEDFLYHDGETATRIWTINRHKAGVYTGRADDIIGDANGEVMGNVLHWRYDFLLKTESKDIKVHFDDWMYRQDERHLFNMTTITKWGIRVGEVTLFFRKKEE